jgi:LuxR family transcriptional activator of conjugal transfer of Ti plasmids
MKTPREDVIAGAIAVLGTAGSLDDLADGAAALVDGMGLQRYTIADLRGGLLVRLIHDAPAPLDTELAGLQAEDPVATRARSARVPFVWQCADGSWQQRFSDLGYRSGVAAASIGHSGTGCIVMLSSDDAEVPSEHQSALLTHAFMAAMHLCGPLRQLAPPKLDCPFSERELECLLYALAGKSSKETARALGIESRTVETYLGRARYRLGVSSSYAAATTALRRGWLDVQRASELAGLGPATGTRKVL